MLHWATGVLGWWEDEPQRRVTAPTPLAGTQLEIGLQLLPEPGPGEAPGGGSPDPVAEAPAAAAPEQLQPAPARAPRAALAPEQRELPAIAERATSADEFEPEPADAAELLEHVDGHFEAEPVRPQLARQQRLASRTPLTATAPVVARSDASLSRHAGEGPGANGGPGGPGRGRGYGRGVVTRRFAFGGPSGAFRADVCLIDPAVRSLREIKSCPRVATFFTNELNVSPRRFTEGFPGVSDRMEFFAIRYTGKFQVAESGYYKFRLISDDGAILYIDGHAVVDNDGQHPPMIKAATIPLTAGQHELFVSYYQGPRETLALQLFVQREGGSERLLGPSF